MKCFLLLFLAFSFFSFSLPAHEARVNPDQRQAIRESLLAKGCNGPLSQVALSRTRGVSRGATQSVTRGDKSSLFLPPEAEQYSNYFSLVIPAEFDLPYGHKDDPKSHIFFRRDPYEGVEKIKVQKELGINWLGDSAPTTISTWIEMASNFRTALKVRGIETSETFVPALVLYRDLGEVKNEATGKITMKREYRFIDPITEKFPDDMSKWKMLNKDVQFNIPFAPIFEAMQQGKFPLLDAAHDISHFVSFLRFPEFAKAVRAQMIKMPIADVNSAFKGREYWLTEALSLPDPNGMSKNHQFLNENKRSTAVRDVAMIEKELAALDDAQLISYSYKLAKHLESQLRDVSGGNSNSAEKWYYLSESFGMRAEDLLNEDISKARPILQAVALGNVYFNNAPITLNANPKALTNETATFSFSTFVAAQKLLALSLGQNKEAGVSRKEALMLLAKYASRTEYLLAEKPFTYKEWAEAFLKGDLPQTEPVAKMLSIVFSNEIVTKYYLGKGEARPGKKHD